MEGKLALLPLLHRRRLPRAQPGIDVPRSKALDLLLPGRQEPPHHLVLQGIIRHIHKLSIMVAEIRQHRLRHRPVVVHSHGPSREKLSKQLRIRHRPVRVPRVVAVERVRNHLEVRRPRYFQPALRHQRLQDLLRLPLHLVAGI